MIFGAIAADNAPLVTASTESATFVQIRPMTNYGIPTPTNFFKEFAGHFDLGDVPANHIVEWRLANGTTVIPSQADNRVTWSDGSLRSASFTMKYPNVIAGSASTTLRGYSKVGTWNNTSWATTSAITARDIRMELTLPTPLTQQIGTGNGVLATFSATLSQTPLRPGTVSISWSAAGTTKVATDDGSGGWLAASYIAGGSVNYVTGAVTISMTTSPNYAPKSGTAVTANYTTTGPGVVYTLSANNEVARGTNIQQKRSGPNNAMWRIFGEFRAGTLGSSTPQGQVWGIFYLTFFPDGTYNVWGTIENSRFTQNTASAKVVIDYKIKDYVGGATLFDYATSFTLYGGCPVFCCDTDGLHPYTGTSVDKTVVGFPIPVLGDPTTRGLYDSMVTWWQVSTPAMIAALDTTSTATYFPNSRGDAPLDINGTGLHEFVGILSGRQATAMMAQDWNSLRADRVNAFTFAPCQGSFQDATAGIGYPGNVTLSTVYPGLGTANRITSWIQPGGSIAVSGGKPLGGTPLDGSHAGLWAYYQAFSTGQEPWLDLLQNQCIGQLGWPPNAPGGATGRNPTVNGIPFYANYAAGGQVRAGGWNLRNVGHTYWITPDNHPMKPYLSDIEQNTFNVFAEYVRPPNSPATMAPMGIYFTQGSNFIAGWMDDYLFTSFCTAVRRGRIPANHHFITFHHIPWTLGRHLSPSCPWGSYSYHYSVGVGPNPTIPSQTPPFTGDVFAQTWDDVWWGEAEEPYPFQLIKGPGNGACPVSGLYAVSNSNFAVGGSSYPNQGRVAVTLAMQVGLATAATAYTYIENEMVLTNIPESRWADLGGCSWRIDVPQ